LGNSKTMAVAGYVRPLRSLVPALQKEGIGVRLSSSRVQLGVVSERQVPFGSRTLCFKIGGKMWNVLEVAKKDAA
jgi:hypothetical protein